jgi:glycosyltransferase involved in cell wall biosynthesis
MSAPAATPAPRPDARPRYSVVIPVHDEEENVAPLAARLREAMDRLNAPYEVLFVDDGSSDGSAAALRGVLPLFPRARLVRFRRNFGQAAALAAGFDEARGDVVISLDADLQNDPEDIPLLLARLAEGYDVVCGWRQDRKEGALPRRAPSVTANWLIRKTTGVPIHDTGCTLRACRREILAQLPLHGGLHRFIPALAADLGARVAEVPVRHHARAAGRSKYGLTRTLPVFLDLLFVGFAMRFARRPLYFFTGLGLAVSLLGAAMLGYLTVLKVGLGEAIGHRPLLLFGVLFVLAGLQLASFGMLAGLLYKFHLESRGGTPYSVLEVVEGGRGASGP